MSVKLHTVCKSTHSVWDYTMCVKLHTMCKINTQCVIIQTVCNFTLSVKLHTICNVCTNTHCVWINTRCTKLHSDPLRVQYEKIPLTWIFLHSRRDWRDWQIWGMKKTNTLFVRLSSILQNSAFEPSRGRLLYIHPVGWLVGWSVGRRHVLLPLILPP